MQLLEVPRRSRKGSGKCGPDATRTLRRRGQDTAGFSPHDRPAAAEFESRGREIYEEGLTPGEIKQLMVYLRTPLGEKLRAESATKRIATLSEQFLAAIAAELSTYLGGAAALGR